MADSIELTYLKTKDLSQKYRKTLKWSITSKVAMALIAAGVTGLSVFGILYFTGSIGTFTGRSVAEYMLLGFFFGFASQIILYRINRIFVKNRYLNAYSLQGEVNVKLDANGLELKDRMSTSNISWVAVRDIVEFSYGFGINLLDIEIIPVPSDALPDGITKEEALACINTWRSA